MSPNPKRALVLGGTGAIGQEVLRLLSEEGALVGFTFYKNAELAKSLSEQLGVPAYCVDLSDREQTRRLLANSFERSADGATEAGCNVAIHCAAVLDTAPLAELSDKAWEQQYAVNFRSALLLCQQFVRARSPSAGGDIVLLSALSAGQSLPLPSGFAATQGALSSLAMALAKEYGAQGLRINVVASGLLETGLATQLSDKLRKQFLDYSALGRLGQPCEVAKMVGWLALCNHYINGKTVAVNGGL